MTHSVPLLPVRSAHWKGGGRDGEVEEEEEEEQEEGGGGIGRRMNEEGCDGDEGNKDDTNGQGRPLN